MVLGSVRPKIWRVSRRAGSEIWKVGARFVSDSSVSESSRCGGLGGDEGGWKAYVVKRDLSRKAEAVCLRQLGQLGQLGAERQQQGRRTFHDARLIDGELEPLWADVDVCFGGEGDAAEEEVQLARRAGHGREDGRHVVGHGGWVRRVDERVRSEEGRQTQWWAREADSQS